MGKVAIGTIIAIVTIPLKEVDALPTAHFGMPQATSRDSQRVDLLRLLSSHQFGDPCGIHWWFPWDNVFFPLHSGFLCRLCIFCNFGAKFST